MIHIQEQVPQRENNKKRMLLLILLALLINFALILVIFFLEYKDHLISFFDTAQETHEAPVVFDTLPPQLQPQQQHMEKPKIENLQPPRIAALKSGASTFGATEQVQEEPEFKPTPEQPAAEDETREDKPEPDLPDELNAVKEILEKLAHRTDPILEKIPAQKAQQPAQMPEPLPGAPQADQQKPDAAAQKVHSAPAQKDATPLKKKRRRRSKKTASTGQGEKVASPMKKKLTFADLANGFVNTLNRGGQDYCDRDGDESIRPDLAEMKTISYFNKLIWYMQNAWRQDPDAHTFTLPSGIKDSVISYVTINLNKDGSLIGCNLVQSCGYAQMDEFVLRGIQSATPFPPIPLHLKKDTIAFSFGVVHYADRSNLKFSFG